MKRVILVLGLLYLMTGCNEVNIGTDYRPMLFLQGQLYGDTGVVIQNLPVEIVLIGEVKELVPQNEPIKKEELTSNTLPVGSQVFLDVADTTILYLELQGEQRYVIYELLE